MSCITFNCILLLVGSAICYNCKEDYSGPHYYIMRCQGEDFRVPKPKAAYEDIVSLWLNLPNLRLHREDFIPFKACSDLFLYDVPIEKQRHNVSLDTFKGLFKDRLLFYIDNSSLDDSMVWTLPAGTMEVGFRNNNYTRMDLSTAPVLKEVHMDDNMLINLPKFYNTSTIIVLNFYNNPLHELTVEGVAPFCNLKKFYFLPTPNSYLLTKEAICVCEELHSFFNVYNITGFNVTCANWKNVSFWKRIWGCDVSLSNAKRIRKNCRDDLSLLKFPRSRIQSLWKWLLIVIITLLLLSLPYGVYFMIFKRPKQDKIEESAVNENEEGLDEEEGEGV